MNDIGSNVPACLPLLRENYDDYTELERPNVTYVPSLVSGNSAHGLYCSHSFMIDPSSYPLESLKHHVLHVRSAGMQLSTAASPPASVLVSW